MNTNQCDHERINEFFRNDTIGLNIELTQHLDACESCRTYFDSQAAPPEQWSEAQRMLQPTAFDHASTAEFSAGGQAKAETSRPLMIQAVLDSLIPSEYPDRLGRLGSYEVSGVVGVGGMGVVLKAIEPALDRVVAIKVMAPHLASNGTARKRFAREAKAAAAVLHPNVIPIYSVSSDDTIPYLVMAYIRGGSLQHRLNREGPLATVEILRIGSQVAAGLAAAHEQGLVHRDVKPENILLEDGVERVTLTDFGLARTVDDASITRDGSIAGTPQYMSPEQARGESIDQKSDLFSLGGVLYAVCTGRPPFRADTALGVMRRISDESSAPIRELNPDVPEWLCNVIEKLMAKDKENRYESAAEVHKLLDSCLGHIQQPTVVALPIDRLPKNRSEQAELQWGFPVLNRFRFLTAITLLGAAVLGLLIMQGFGKHSAAQVTGAYQEVRSYYDGAQDVFPGNQINVLLVSDGGPEYLRKLDQEFDRIEYMEGQFSNGFEQIVVYMCDNRQTPQQTEIILTARREDFQRGGGVGFPDQIKPTSIKILRRGIANDVTANRLHPDGQLEIKFTVSDNPEHRKVTTERLGLVPGESYSVEVDIIDVVEDRVDGIELWKRGKRLSGMAQTPDRRGADNVGALMGDDYELHITHVVRHPKVQRPSDTIPDSEYKEITTGTRVFRITDNRNSLRIVGPDASESVGEIQSRIGDSIVYQLTPGLDAGAGAASQLILTQSDDDVTATLTQFGSEIPVVVSYKGRVKATAISKEESISRIEKLLNEWKDTPPESEGFDDFASKIIAIRDDLLKQSSPYTEKRRQVLDQLSLSAWHHLQKPLPAAIAKTLADLTQPYAAIRVSDRLAQQGRPTEPVGWDVQAAYALALARAGETEKALKENQQLLAKIEVNIRFGQLPDLRLEFHGTKRSPKSLLKQTLLQKSVILAVAGRTAEAVDASTAVGVVKVNNPTQDDQLAIQAMLRVLADAMAASEKDPEQ
ncbi:MAG: serine/threonine-protein kinase [Pirellulaceae bacterium]